MHSILTRTHVAQVRLGSEVLYAIMFVIYIKNLVIRIRWSKSVFE